MFRIFLNFRY